MIPRWLARISTEAPGLIPNMGPAITGVMAPAPPRTATARPSPGAHYEVRNGRNDYHLIPYIGNKSGFSHIFDELVPAGAGGRCIVDAFGGGGSFAIYCCFRFGSDRVVYNDNNPILANFMECVRDDPDGLIREYEAHRALSSQEYFLCVRNARLDRGLEGAGRFLYLSKNAFSGKIRFNKSNRFNAPMRKGTRCPALDSDRLRRISRRIRNMRVTNETFERFEDIRDAFLYLDPPYMNNANNHYNGVPATEDFARFVRKVTPQNLVMISEQNEPDQIGIPGSYRIYDIRLRRSLQYVTQTGSREIIAINYPPD